jgi:hypothetical protein
MKASTDGMKKEKEKERKKERNPTTQQDAITLLDNELLLACPRKTCCTPMETSEAAAPASAPIA